MTINKPTASSVSRTLVDVITNSLQFEIASSLDYYSNPDIPLAETSDHQLKLYRIPLLERIDDILMTSTLATFETPRDAELLFHRPKLLSYNRYGVTDYWWLILAINGFDSVYDFKDFEYLWIPDQNTVKKIIMDIEFKESNA